MTTLDKLGIQVGASEQEAATSSLQSLGIQIEQQAAPAPAMPTAQAPDPREIPQVDATGRRLDTPDAVDISQAPNRRRGFLETTFAPMRPVQAAGQAIDMMAGVNRLAVTLADLPAQTLNLALGAAGIDERAATLAEQPWIQQAITPSQREGAELRATAGEFAAGGVGTNLLARQIVGTAPEVVYGGDSVMRGILKDVARMPLPKEAAMGAASGIGAVAGEEVGGQPGAVAGSILAPLLLLRRPKKPTRPGQHTAAEILQSEAERPAEALTSLTARQGRPLTAVEKTNDPGIMTLYRSLARHNSRLAGDLDAAYRLNQNSLMDELGKLVRPDGTPDPEALSSYLIQQRDNLLNLQDDVIRAATTEMQHIAQVTGQKDPVLLARSFRNALENLLPDVRQQERVLWQLSNPDIDTTPLKQAAVDIVTSAPKTARLPKKELEQIIGVRIREGLDGWELTDQAVRGALRGVEPAEALVTLRSNLLDDIRAQTKGALTKPKSVPIMQRLQAASIDALDQGAAVDPQFKEAYDTARAFTRRMHETFEQGIVGRVLSTNPTRGDVVLPEQTLKVMFEGGREQQAAAARELTDVLLMESGVRGTPIQQSPIGRDAAAYLMGRFREEATDANKARQFMLDNQHALYHAPEVRKTLEAATQKMAAAGQRVATAESQKEAIRAAKFNDLIGLNPEQTISTILRDPNPGKAAVALRKRIERSPEAMQSLQHAVAEYMMRRASEVSKLPNLDRNLTKRGMLKGMRELDPLLATFYTQGHRQNMRRILEDVASASALRSATPRSIEPPRNILGDLIARMAPTMAISHATSGSSIVLQGAAAGAGRKLMDKLTTKQIQKILSRAATDDKLMETLLKTELTSKDIARIRQIVPETLTTTVQQVDEQVQE